MSAGALIDRRHASMAAAARRRGVLDIGEAEEELCRALSAPGWDGRAPVPDGFAETAREGLSVAASALDARDYGLAAWALRGTLAELAGRWPGALRALAGRREGAGRLEVDPGVAGA